MNHIYVLMSNENEWEDMVMYLTEEEAIRASIQHSNWRVEIFTRNEKGYVPTYHYYKNGVLVDTQT